MTEYPITESDGQERPFFFAPERGLGELWSVRKARRDARIKEAEEIARTVDPSAGYVTWRGQEIPAAVYRNLGETGMAKMSHVLATDGIRDIDYQGMTIELRDSTPLITVPVTTHDGKPEDRYFFGLPYKGAMVDDPEARHREFKHQILADTALLKELNTTGRVEFGWGGPNWTIKGKK